MFDDIELNIGEVLPSSAVDSNLVFSVYTGCTDICSCNSQCCRTSKICC